MQHYLLVLGTSLALAALFKLFERLRPAERSQSESRWWFNLAYMPFVLAFVMLLNPLLTPLFAWAVIRSGGGILPAVVGPDSQILAQLLFTLAYAFVWDLTQYGVHRLQHAVPALWETHKFHHDEPALSAVVQARHHPTSSFLAALFHLPILLLFGSQAPHLIAAFLMFTLWGFVNHANVRLHLGPFTPLIAGPQWHRIHHSRLERHRDRNFAVLFPAIDLMFGTYYRPRPDEYPPTGIDGETVPSLRAATVEPFVAWIRMWRVRRASI